MKIILWELLKYSTSGRFLEKEEKYGITKAQIRSQEGGNKAVRPEAKRKKSIRNTRAIAFKTNEKTVFTFAWLATAFDLRQHFPIFSTNSVLPQKGVCKKKTIA